MTEMGSTLTTSLGHSTTSSSFNLLTPNSTKTEGDDEEDVEVGDDRTHHNGTQDKDQEENAETDPEAEVEPSSSTETTKEKK